MAAQAPPAPPTVINLKINGKDYQTKPGTLLINLCKEQGIEIPAFCYYEGLSLQAACRMCLVQVAKMPKPMPACTLVVTEGMEVQTESQDVVDVRKQMLESKVFPGGSFEARRKRVMRRSCRSWASRASTSKSRGRAGCCSAWTNRETISRTAVVSANRVRSAVI